METCYQHPEVEARTRCGGCGKPLCNPCALFEGGKDRCPSCLVRYRRNQKLRTGLLALAGVAVLGLGVAWAMGLLPPLSLGTPAEPGFDYGVRASVVRRLRAQLEAEPCNRSKAVELAQELSSHQDWHGTLQLSEDFMSRCEHSTQLQQLVYSAHMRLGQHELAVQAASRLLERAPRNVNYLVWRGQAHQALNAPEQALADFQQAFSLQPEQLHLARLLATAQLRLQQPCEARRTLQHFLQSKPPEPARTEASSWAAQLERDSPCGTQAASP